MCPGVGLEGLRWSALPFDDVEVRRHAQFPAFAPDSSEVAVGFPWSSCIFCPYLAPDAHALSYFWSLVVSLYFVAGGKASRGATAAAKGPSLSQLEKQKGFLQHVVMHP